MSLILEALRKSEAERRRGQAPSLYSELPVSRPSPSRSAPWPWLLAAAALLLAALGWWRGQPTTMPSASPMAPTQPIANAPPSATRPAGHAPPTNAAPRFVPTPPAKPSEPAKAPELPPAASPASAAAPVEAAAIASEPSATNAAASPELSAEPELPALADLDSVQRAELPALKLSMHVWNLQPEQRFVILDGQRLSEGGRAGEAVVETITRDGLILVWRGQRLRLARP